MELKEKKSVIFCGDLNVAHLEIGIILYYSSTFNKSNGKKTQNAEDKTENVYFFQPFMTHVNGR